MNQLLPRSGQIAARAGAAIAGGVALAGLGWLARSKLAVRQPDPFYTPPADMSHTSGDLIRYETLEASWVPASAQVWRILYVTTDGAGQPTASSALVIVPRGSTGAPVIAWAHATSGIDPASAPSLAKTGPASGGLYILDQVLAEGWALVATDYAGLGTSTPHAWLSGAPAAHSVLDSVRAARQLAGARLGERTVVWGYSQGGHAALWTGIEAAAYAPEVQLIGVAACAPVSRPIAVVKHLAERPVVGATLLTSYAIVAYSQTYADVDFDAYVRPSQRAHVRRVARNGFLNPLTMVTALIDRAVRPGIFKQAPDTGPLGARLAQNEASGSIKVPLLIAQGNADDLVPPSMQDDYVAALRAQGQDVDYRRFDGLTHLSLMQSPSPFIPQLMEWTRARFAV